MERKLYICKPYINANKTNTLIFANATAIALAIITLSLTITPYINTFPNTNNLSKLIY